MTASPVSARFAGELLAWWDQHGRHDLPWQQDKTLYRVWVSEIMLQQTQVTTVLNYYPSFVRSFPDVGTLAAASEDEVLHHWSGLGYYSRARNLHKAARLVVTDHGGEVPAVFAALLSLPGIGRSTAGAILALTCGQRFPILDGNAKRVLARLFAVEGWTGTTAALKQLWQLAEECTPHERVADYTQAIMDLGATLCTRGKPRCELCPVTGLCSAYQTGQVASIPAPKPKKVKPKREVAMVLAVSPAGVLLEKRPPAGIWAGLWSFPELDGPDAVADWCRQALGCEPEAQQRWPAVAHSFTHFDLTMHPVEVRLADTAARVMEADRWLWYNSAAPADVGLAAPVARLLRQLEAGENNIGAAT